MFMHFTYQKIRELKKLKFKEVLLELEALEEESKVTNEKVEKAKTEIEKRWLMQRLMQREDWPI